MLLAAASCGDTCGAVWAPVVVKAIYAATGLGVVVVILLLM